ncbi:MAG: hypothetical protein U5R49_23960 [Deltaproteobacteria bacterium]|nr:hypothetical protein [Deltaproteobacteria bacterium]
MRDQIRSILTGIGFSEIITYSFISPESADTLNADETSDLRRFTGLMNPLSKDQSVLRTSLLPGVMATVAHNRLNGEKDLRLFEWGKVFKNRKGDPQPLEQNMLVGAITGRAQQRTWYSNRRDVDFYDIKGCFEALLTGLGVDSARFERKNGFPGYDAESSCGVYASKTCIGQMGKASSSMKAAYDIEEDDVFIFEMNVAELLPFIPTEKRFRPFPRFPAVYRDISLVVDQRVESGRIVEFIQETGKDLLESVHIFDIYEGDQIGECEKAIAFRISYRSDKGTLDGDTVNRLYERMIRKVCNETGGRLREG